MTGATGHLGTALVQMLLASGARVRYICRPESGIPTPDGPALERWEAPLDETERIEQALRGVDVVFHTAARISLVDSDWRELHRVNVEGTRSVLEAAVRAGVDRFVHVGSVEAFPLALGRYPITERHGIDPDHTILEYGRTKALGIRHVLETPTGNTRVVVCCPTALIGPPDYRPSETGRMVQTYLRRRLPACIDGGFDFMDVRDAAAALILAAEHGRNRGLYLLAGCYASMPQLIELLEQESGVQRPLICLPLKLVRPLAPAAETFARLTGTPPLITRGTMRIVSLGVRIDASASRRELGYTTRPLRETVADTVAWFRRLEARDPATHHDETGPEFVG